MPGSTKSLHQTALAIAAQALHAVMRTVLLSLFNLVELITIAGLSWCALAAISWPMLRRHAGTYFIFQVCTGFGVAIYIVSHAAHLLRFGFLSVLAIQLGLILVASLVGLALFLFFRAEDAAGWSWRGFFFAYVLPLMTVASSPRPRSS